MKNPRTGSVPVRGLGRFSGLCELFFQPQHRLLVGVESLLIPLGADHLHARQDDLAVDPVPDAVGPGRGVDAGHNPRRDLIIPGNHRRAAVLLPQPAVPEGPQGLQLLAVIRQPFCPDAGAGQKAAGAVLLLVILLIKRAGLVAIGIGAESAVSIIADGVGIRAAEFSLDDAAVTPAVLIIFTS